MTNFLAYFFIVLIFAADVYLQSINSFLFNKVNENFLTYQTFQTVKFCPFGSLPSPTNVSKCYAKICHNNFDCTTNFGPNTMCSKLMDIGICACDKTHKLDNNVIFTFLFLSIENLLFKCLFYLSFNQKKATFITYVLKITKPQLIVKLFHFNSLNYWNLYLFLL